MWRLGRGVGGGSSFLLRGRASSGFLCRESFSQRPPVSCVLRFQPTEHTFAVGGQGPAPAPQTHPPMACRKNKSQVAQLRQLPGCELTHATRTSSPGSHIPRAARVDAISALPKAPNARHDGSLRPGAPSNRGTPVAPSPHTHGERWAMTRRSGRRRRWPKPRGRRGAREQGRRAARVRRSGGQSALPALASLRPGGGGRLRGRE